MITEVILPATDPIVRYECPRCGYAMSATEVEALRFDVLCPRCARYGVWYGFTRIFADGRYLVRVVQL